jgi:hypothetical protein
MNPGKSSRSASAHLAANHSMKESLNLSMTELKDNAAPKRKIIIQTWENGGRGLVGEKELRRVQRALRERFGEGAVDSPAAIARVLADEGAVLRHPELIEFDTRWRRRQLEQQIPRAIAALVKPSAKGLTLKRARRLIKQLEKLRKRCDGDKEALRRLRDLAVEAKQRAQSFARRAPTNQEVSAEQAEIAEWFTVWLQTPELFDDWLDLRQRAADFHQKFSGQKPQSTSARR